MNEARPERAAHRRRGRIVIAIVAIALIALAATHLLRSRKRPHAPAAQTVTVASAVIGDMPETLNALGTVTPVATVTVLSQLSGYLTAVGYQEGQDVAKGQFLAQIDPRPYEISKRQAEAQLAKDRAVLAQARSDLARYARLNAQKSIAAQTFADQRFAVQQSEAAVKADQASIAQYDLDLDYCRITAPVAGRVGLRLVDSGNYVTASTQPGIVVITTMKPTTVEFAIAQNALAKVLQRFDSGAKLPVTVYNSDNSRQLATGTLYAISNQMSTSTGTVTLRATFANRDEVLFPNEFVNTRLLVDTLHDAVLVPTAAVQSGAPGDYVYLARPDHTVTVRKVTIGPSDGKNTVITAGLTAGDQVVTDGLDRLSDGARINPVEGGAASGKDSPTPSDPERAGHPPASASRSAAAS